MRHRSALLLPALLLGALWAAPPALADFSLERLERLDTFLDSYVEQGRLPGAVLQVTHDGETAYHRATGLRDMEAGAPMRPDTIFRIASMSKAVISAAVMVLQEQGALVIGQPVGDFLPEFAATTVAVPGDDGGYDVVDAERPITIRDLLTHTAGIGYGYGPAAEQWEAAGLQHWYFGHREETIRETVRRIAEMPMDAQPGEAFVYGYNTDILGAVVEAASGQPLDAFLQAEIFGPLGMKDTSFYLPLAKADRLVTVYSRTEAGDLVPAHPDTPFHGQGHYVEGPRASFSGGAGLLSTTADYTRFLEALRRGGPVLGRKSVESMTVNHLPADLASLRPGAGFGLGFAVVSDLGAWGQPGSVGEFSWGGAYHTSYWVDPAEELTVVYMTQVLPAPGLDDFSKVRALIYQALD
ncbi:MAG: beta-lactamase family protein [Gammaproteobacteria bacterium]|nr:beta-lactamase family protein [Gammaproteobacteria bacterium]